MRLVAEKIHYPEVKIMDEIIISIDLENLNDNERKLLMSLVEKGGKPKRKVWKPATGQMVYIITAENKVNVFCYNDRNSYDRMAYEIGNLFPTKEAAEEAAKRRKILKRWKDMSIESGEEENPWDCERLHYEAYYSYSIKHVDIAYCRYYKYESTTYFATENSIRDAIKEIGEENIKKYIFNVKE
jgi:hypothetical protein